MSEENKIEMVPFHVVPFEVKMLEEKSDRYEFNGHASVFHVPDRIKDIVHPGAFKRTIDHNSGKFALDWMHQKTEIIGGVKVHEDSKGLAVEPGYLIKGIQRAEEAYKLMKAKVIDGMSFMFKPIQRKFDRGFRHLHEIRVGSVTVGPSSLICHPNALITDVKFEDMGEIEIKNLMDVQMFEHNYSTDEAFKNIKSFYLPGYEYSIRGFAGITANGVQLKSLRFDKMAGWTEKSIDDWIRSNEEELKFLDITCQVHYEIAHAEESI